MTNPIPSIDLLNRLIRAADIRQSAIGQNLANLNTPGYHRIDVSFEDALTRELKAPTAAPDKTALPVVREDTTRPPKENGNNVDLEHEVGRLSANSLKYQTFTQLLTTQYQMYQRAISSGS